MARSKESPYPVENVEVRPLRDHAEYRATLALQQHIWGFSHSDCLPPRLVTVAVEIGGLALGAFSHEQMIGFSVAFPGLSRPAGTGQQQNYWHSHMTGILPEWQGHGIGKRIKLRQREEALRANIDYIEWTFDPLEIRNAYFNIERLGIIARRFLPNQYGITSSRLHGGLPTDRLVAEWCLASKRVRSVVAKKACTRIEVARTIKIPEQIADLRISDNLAAQEIQKQVGEQIQQAFADKLVVVGYRLEKQTGVYELGWLEE